ncbi:MAG: type II secretion system protein [Planctomycetes bacterium]|nr:type II secretion system protein [Planctomycetota bacterium]
MIESFIFWYSITSRHKLKFSLIELLLVMAILTIFSSLLSPVLKESLSSTRTILCLSNLENLGGITSLYMEDNNQYFPPPGWNSAVPQLEVRRHIEFGVTWDDRLSDYDGRELTSDIKKKVKLGIHEINKDHSSYKLYVCPNDDLVRTPKENLTFLPRTYAINGHGLKNKGFLNQTTATGIGSGCFSVSIDEIEDVQGTIYMAEVPARHNKVGTYTQTAIKVPRESFRYFPDNRTGLHSDLKFTYLFSDGHVELLSIIDTVSSKYDSVLSSFKQGDKMWTRQYD